MFCPNCGKDCSDVKLYPDCGLTLNPEAQLADNHIPDSLIGRSEGVDGYIELSYYTITICKKILSETITRVIPYRDISKVIFQQGTDTQNGFLTIHEKEDCLSVVESEWDAMADEKSLVFHKNMNHEFHARYTYLTQLVDNRKSHYVQNPKQENAVNKKNRNEDTRCPQCGSNSYHYSTHNRVHYRPFLRGKSLIAAIILMVMYLYYFFTVELNFTAMIVAMSGLRKVIEHEI